MKYSFKCDTSQEKHRNNVITTASLKQVTFIDRTEKNGTSEIHKYIVHENRRNEMVNNRRAVVSVIARICPSLTNLALTDSSDQTENHRWTVCVVTLTHV